jgi:hypothetical protein
MSYVSNFARPQSPSLMPLVMHFFMSNGARQIRILFEKDSKTWTEMKEIMANILAMDLSDLLFSNNITLANVDEEDDESADFVNKLAVYTCTVHNKSFLASIEKQLEEKSGEQVLHIILLNGERYTFAMNFSTETVADLKRCLEMKLGVLSMQQRLVFGGHILADDFKLLCNIEGLSSGSEITFVYRMLDGVMPQVSARESIFDSLSPLTVYDANEREIKFTTRPFLFRSQA